MEYGSLFSKNAACKIYISQNFLTQYFMMMEQSNLNDLFVYNLMSGELQRRRRQILPKTPDGGVR